MPRAGSTKMDALETMPYDTEVAFKQEMAKSDLPETLVTVDADPPPDSSTTLPPNNAVSPAKEDTKPNLQPGGLQPTIPVGPPGGPKFSVFDTEARYCLGLNPVNVQFIFHPVAFPFPTKPAAGDDEERPTEGRGAGERKRLKEKAIETRKKLPKTRTRRKRPSDPRRAKPRANMNAKVFHLVSDSFLFRMILGHV